MQQLRLGFIVAVTLLAACVEQPRTQLQDTNHVTIYRDKWGTPHIHAADNYGVYFGYGYALASDRLFQMEMLQRTVNGRVSEVLGADYLALDSHIRSSYDHRAVARQLADLPTKDRQVLEAYAAGYSKRVTEVLAGKHALPAEFSHYGFKPGTWSASDAAMQFIGAIAHRYSDFNSELDNAALLGDLEKRHSKAVASAIFNASKWLLDKDSPTTVPRNSDNLTINTPGTAAPALDAATTRRVYVDSDGAFIGTSASAGATRQFNALLGRHGWGFSAEFAPASNYWAVQNLRDADAAFVNGPQFGWSTPSYVYGVGLHGGDFNVVGNTLLGLPALLFAHNGSVAWGSTAGLSDQVDVYIETLNPENPEQYWHNGKYKDFERWEERIITKDGSTHTVIARRSVHGMVQQWLPKQGRAYTRARSWEGTEVATLAAWINLAKDTSLDAMHQRIAAVGTNINFYTMDAAGNLGYVHAGRYPRRHPDHDSRLPSSGDGRHDWQGYLPYSANPTVHNPAQAYIVNWNNRPAAQWPSSDLWSLTWARSDRVDHLSNAIEQTRPEQRDVDWLWGINRDVSYKDVSATYLLPHLKAAWQAAARPDTEAPSSPDIDKALALLLDWDQQWLDTDGHFGPAPTLMEAWHRHLLLAAFSDDIGPEKLHLYSATHTPNHSLGPSMSTPPGTRALLRNLDKLAAQETPDYDFFNGKAQAVLRDSFRRAVTELTAEYGAPDNWRLASYGLRWQPYNFRGVPQALPDNTQRLSAYMNRGSENNLFIARNGRIESFDVVPPGQHASGTHASDQLQLFADFGYKRVPVTLDEVKAQAVTREIISIGRSAP